MPDKNAAAHRVLNNAKIFRELGYHVAFCGVDHDITENAKEVTKIDSFDNIPAAYPKSTSEWVRQQIDFSHIRKAIEFYNDVKYVVAYNMHALPLFRLQRYAKKKNISVIADVTEWYEYFFSFKLQKFIRWLDTNIVMRYLTKKVDGLIAISSYLKNYYQKYIENIVVVPPLVDLTEDVWQADCEKKNDCLEFVYSGVPGSRNEKDKIGMIIECLEKLPAEKQFMFTVIGITEPQFLAIYPELSKTLEKLNGKIQFSGRVSHRESIVALKKADYSLIIRDRNRKNMAGFPTKFVESYTSGIGIIVNNFSDVAQYLPKEGKNILINSSKVDRVLDALQDVFKGDLQKIRFERMNNRKEFDFHNWKSVFELLIV